MQNVKKEQKKPKTFGLEKNTAKPCMLSTTCKIKFYKFCFEVLIEEISILRILPHSFCNCL